MINAPFGDCHDGRGAGVWAAGSQSLREGGFVPSRLGTRSKLSGTYANHPPMNYVETALAEVVVERCQPPSGRRHGSEASPFIVVVNVLLREPGLRRSRPGWR